VRRLPQYNLSTDTYVRAVLASLAVGAVTGVAWWFFNFITYGWIFALILGAGMGYAIGEAVAVATNRRAGPPLQIIAAGGAVVAYAVRLSMLVIIDGWTLAELRGFEFFALLVVVLAGWIAMQRVR
jgi:hypothetical protein